MTRDQTTTHYQTIVDYFQDKTKEISGFNDLTFVMDYGESDLKTKTQLVYQPLESHLHKPLIFIDWIANFVWRHYEDKRSLAYEILQPHLQEELLFFEEN